VAVSTPSESMDPLIGAVLGRHRLVRLLGEGGMGVVYEGTHQDLGRRAAVKILHKRYAQSEELRLRFVREGQAAARVRHPNVVHVYDVGVEGSQPYLIMEFLDGEDLGQLLAREGSLSVERTADILLPVVTAVAAAHELGVVHRDLKPENIFLSAERGAIKAKVLDFGISKIVDRERAEPLTGTGAFLGTPQYMSPEQAQGAKHIDQRTDQYSLGVILYQCVTGRRPLEEPSIYALIQRIVRGDFPPPRQLNADLPIAFEALILRAMACDPEERFVSTRALGRALLEFASDRIRAQHADELSFDPLATTASARPLRTSERPRVGTTLGDSIAERDLPAASPSTRRWLGLGGVLLLVAGVSFARSWSSSHSPSAPLLPSVTAISAARPAPEVASAAPATLVPEATSVASTVTSPPAPASPAGVEPKPLVERTHAPASGATKPQTPTSSRSVPSLEPPAVPEQQVTTDPYAAQK
jgi:eukaryotic-like serine/threonine-protein kinase